MDIHQILESCLSEFCFLCNNVVWKLENSGPMCLSIMVILFECYLQRIEHIHIYNISSHPQRNTKNDLLTIVMQDLTSENNHCSF